MDNTKTSPAKPWWHSRGVLPHFEGGSIPQAVTFRLADSLPRHRLDELSMELKRHSSADMNKARCKQIEKLLDAGSGQAWLKQPEIAELVQSALLFFDSKRYSLHAWVIMPTHVHLLFTPYPEWTLSKLLHSGKSFTATIANRLLHRTGEFWSEEYFDRAIRDERHYAAVVEYIEGNPVKAGLCGTASEWKFSSAYTEGDLGGRASSPSRTGCPRSRE